MVDLDLLAPDEPREAAGAPAWMLTFADLSLQMLTFFVVLVSFGEADVRHFRDLLGSVHRAFGVQIDSTGHLEALHTTAIAFAARESSTRMPLDQRQADALRRIERFVKQRSFGNDVEIRVGEKEVVVRLKDRVAFAPASDALDPAVLPLLDRVADLAVALDEGLTIEGHTDDTPIHTVRFPSNWELSTARAAAALRYLQTQRGLKPARVRIAGYADTRPVATDGTEESRARNRRVEFVLERSSPGVPVAP